MADIEIVLIKFLSLSEIEILEEIGSARENIEKKYNRIERDILYNQREDSINSKLLENIDFLTHLVASPHNTIGHITKEKTRSDSDEEPQTNDYFKNFFNLVEFRLNYLVKNKDQLLTKKLKDETKILKDELNKTNANAEDIKKDLNDAITKAKYTKISKEAEALSNHLSEALDTAAKQVKTNRNWNYGVAGFLGVSWIIIQLLDKKLLEPITGMPEDPTQIEVFLSKLPIIAPITALFILFLNFGIRQTNLLRKIKLRQSVNNTVGVYLTNDDLKPKDDSQGEDFKRQLLLVTFKSILTLTEDNNHEKDANVLDSAQKLIRIIRDTEQTGKSN